MDFKIQEKELNILLNYLAGKPYAEVYQIIGMLSTLSRFDEKVEIKSD